ncbi:MAG: cyclic nucleotide-binding domain-containing protein [Gammaproteobacteria bacterium]
MDSDLTVAQLFRHADDVRVHAAGDVIFREGEPGTHMFALLEGEVSLQIGGLRTWRLRPGELFGEMALIDAKPRSATAVAETPVRLAAIDQRRFLFMVQETPYFAIQIMRLVTGRLREMDQTLA